MFTVKVCSDGVETLHHSAERVTYRGPHANVGPEGVEIVSKDGQMTLIEGCGRVPDGGVWDELAVYVMNDNGKTVAQYRMCARKIMGAGSTSSLKAA